jgi:hypothetical protein
MKSRGNGADVSQRQPAVQRKYEPVRAPPGLATARHSVLQAAIDQSPRMMAQRRALQEAFGVAFQRQTGGLEYETSKQARIASVAQRKQAADEDGLFSQGRFAPAGASTVELQTQAEVAGEASELPLQALVAESSGSSPPFAASPADNAAPVNETGMPDQLKAGIESLSGMDLSDVRIHRNSNRPAALNALAYAQGNHIHLGPAQEQHLPHEAWHVVQQRQGRVRETRQMAGVGVNDDVGLEREADVMGARATNTAAGLDPGEQPTLLPLPSNADSVLGQTAPAQRRVGFEFEMGDIRTEHWGLLEGWHDHAKGAVMSQLQGYRLTADEGAGNSQLEVIIDPIDETDPVAVNNLVAVTAPAVVNTIGSIATAAFNAWIAANQIPGLNGSGWDRYYSQSNGPAGIMGQLQMTGGIAINKLHDHVTGAQATNYLATLNPVVDQDDATAFNTLNAYTNGPIALTATGIVNGIGAFAALTLAERQQIAAIAGLMATVPINMRIIGAIPYVKAAAGSMLMRTDFARTMMALSPAAKNALTPALMLQVVLATINAHVPAGGIVGANAVIPPGAPLPGGTPPLNQLSIAAWITGVVPRSGILWGHWQGRDQLTKQHFPAGQAERAEMESMGGYGNRVDPGNKPIIEFRSLGGVFVPDLTGQLTRMLAFLIHP